MMRKTFLILCSLLIFVGCSTNDTISEIEQNNPRPDFNQIDSEISEITDLAQVMSNTMNYQSIEIELKNNDIVENFVISKTPEMYYHTSSVNDIVDFFIRDEALYGRFRAGTFENHTFIADTDYLQRFENSIYFITELYDILSNDKNIKTIEKTPNGYILQASPYYLDNIIQNNIQVFTELTEEADSEEVREIYAVEVANLKSITNSEQNYEIIVENGTLKEMTIYFSSELMPNEYNGLQQNLLQEYKGSVEVLQFNKNTDIENQINAKFENP